MDYYEPFKIQTAANNVSVRIERRQRTGPISFLQQVLHTPAGK